MFDGTDTANFPTEPPDLPAPEDLIDELAAVMVQRDRIEARAARLLAKVDETRAFERDGYTSRTALLKHRMSLHPGEAQRLVRRANALPEMPLTTRAYEAGAISGAQVDVLGEVRAIAPDHFEKSEAELVAWAVRTPLIRDLRTRLDYWLSQEAPEELAADRNKVRELRAVNLRREADMMRASVWMDLESGERFAARIEPGPPDDGDTRSVAQRRADLLIEMVDGTSRETHMVVHVSADTLLEGRPGTSETSNGTVLTIDEIRRLACDANLTRVVFGPDSRPVDVGRTKRLVTPAQRIAVMARDRHCKFPRCDRHERWCDVHHIVSWIDDGPTDIDNLVLLCRYHHTLVHEAGWVLEGTPWDLHFYRPDGTELGEEPAPRPAPGPRLFPSKPPRPPTIGIWDALEQIRGIPYPRGP